MGSNKPTLFEAMQRRKKMLEEFREVVAACSCLWPLVTLRNRTGHNPECEAHTLILIRLESA